MAGEGAAFGGSMGGGVTSYAHTRPQPVDYEREMQIGTWVTNVQRNFPALATDPELLTQLATSATDETQLFAAAAEMEGVAGIELQLDQLRGLSEEQQRLTFSNLHPSRQETLRRSGYSPPERSRGGLHFNLWSIPFTDVIANPVRSALDFITPEIAGRDVYRATADGNFDLPFLAPSQDGNLVTNALSMIPAAMGGAMDVASDAFGVLDWVQENAVNHPFRAAQRFYEQGLDTSSFGALLRSTSGNMIRAWNETEDPNRSWSQYARQQAERMVNGDLGQFQLAQDLAAGMHLDEIAERDGLTRGTPEFNNAIADLYRQSRSEGVMEATRRLQSGNLTIGGLFMDVVSGRQLFQTFSNLGIDLPGPLRATQAYMTSIGPSGGNEVAMAQGSTAAVYLRGAADFGASWYLDPTLVAGKLNNIRRLNSALRITNDAPVMEQIARAHALAIWSRLDEGQDFTHLSASARDWLGRHGIYDRDLLEDLVLNTGDPPMFRSIRRTSLRREGQAYDRLNDLVVQAHRGGLDGDYTLAELYRDMPHLRHSAGNMNEYQQWANSWDNAGLADDEGFFRFMETNAGVQSLVSTNLGGINDRLVSLPHITRAGAARIRSRDWFHRAIHLGEDLPMEARIDLAETYVEGTGRLSEYAAAIEEARAAEDLKPLLDFSARRRSFFHAPVSLFTGDPELGRVGGFLADLTAPVRHVAQAATSLVPREGIVSITGEEAAEEFMALVNSNTLAHLPPSVTRVMTNAFITGNEAQRQVLVTKLVGEQLAAMGALGTEEGIALWDRFVSRVMHTYGVDDVADHTSDFVSRYGILDTQMADASMIPDLMEASIAARQASNLRHIALHPVRGFLEAKLNSVWKPLQLMRIGYILRAGGEEALTTLLRSGTRQDRLGRWAAPTYVRGLDLLEDSALSPGLREALVGQLGTNYVPIRRRGWSHVYNQLGWDVAQEGMTFRTLDEARELSVARPVLAVGNALRSLVGQSEAQTLVRGYRRGIERIEGFTELSLTDQIAQARELGENLRRGSFAPRMIANAYDIGYLMSNRTANFVHDVAQALRIPDKQRIALRMLSGGLGDLDPQEVLDGYVTAQVQMYATPMGHALFQRNFQNAAWHPYAHRGVPQLNVISSDKTPTKLTSIQTYSDPNNIWAEVFTSDDPTLATVVGASMYDRFGSSPIAAQAVAELDRLVTPDDLAQVDVYLRGIGDNVIDLDLASMDPVSAQAARLNHARAIIRRVNPETRAAFRNWLNDGRRNPRFLDDAINSTLDTEAIELFQLIRGHGRDFNGKLAHQLFSHDARDVHVLDAVGGTVDAQIMSILRNTVYRTGARPIGQTARRKLVHNLRSYLGDVERPVGEGMRRWYMPAMDRQSYESAISSFRTQVLDERAALEGIVDHLAGSGLIRRRTNGNSIRELAEDLRDMLARPGAADALRGAGLDPRLIRQHIEGAAIPAMRRMIDDALRVRVPGMTAETSSFYADKVIAHLLDADDNWSSSDQMGLLRLLAGSGQNAALLVGSANPNISGAIADVLAEMDQILRSPANERLGALQAAARGNRMVGSRPTTAIGYIDVQDAYLTQHHGVRKADARDLQVQRAEGSGAEVVSFRPDIVPEIRVMPMEQMRMLRQAREVGPGTSRLTSVLLSDDDIIRINTARREAAVRDGLDPDRVAIFEGVDGTETYSWGRMTEDEAWWEASSRIALELMDKFMASEAHSVRIHHEFTDLLLSDALDSTNLARHLDLMPSSVYGPQQLLASEINSWEKIKSAWFEGPVAAGMAAMARKPLFVNQMALAHVATKPFAELAYRAVEPVADSVVGRLLPQLDDTTRSVLEESARIVGMHPDPNDMSDYAQLIRAVQSRDGAKARVIFNSMIDQTEIQRAPDRVYDFAATRATAPEVEPWAFDEIIQLVRFDGDAKIEAISNVMVGDVPYYLTHEPSTIPGFDVLTAVEEGTTDIGAVVFFDRRQPDRFIVSSSRPGENYTGAMRVLGQWLDERFPTSVRIDPANLPDPETMGFLGGMVEGGEDALAFDFASPQWARPISGPDGGHLNFEANWEHRLTESGSQAFRFTSVEGGRSLRVGDFQRRAAFQRRVNRNKEIERRVGDLASPEGMRELENWINGQATAFHSVQEATVRRAFETATPFIDDHRVRSAFSTYITPLVPFWYAEELFLKRIARSLMVTPEMFRRGQLLMGLGRDIGVIEKDEFGQEVMIIPGSELFMQTLARSAEIITGGALRIPVAGDLTLSTSNIIPGYNLESDQNRFQFGPLAGIAFSQMSTHFPEWAQMGDRWMGDPRMTRSRPLWEMVAPTWAANLYHSVSGDMNNQRFASAVTTTIAQLEASGHGLPEGATPSEMQDYIDRVRDITRVNQTIMSLIGTATPTTPRSLSVLDGFEAEFRELLRSTDWQTAMTLYLEQHGDDTGALAATISSTEATGAPIQATEEAFQWMVANNEILASYGRGASWYAPMSQEDEPFNQRAWTQMLQSGLRQYRTPEETLTQLRLAEAAPDYYEYRDERDLRLQGVEAQLARGEIGENEARTQRTNIEDMWRIWARGYLNQHPVFAASLTTGSARGERLQTIEELRRVNADPPEGRQSEIMQPLVTAFLDYIDRRDALSFLPSTTGANKYRDAIHADFYAYASNYANLYPEVRAFFNTIIRPEVRGDDDVLAELEQQGVS